MTIPRFTTNGPAAAPLPNVRTPVDIPAAAIGVSAPIDLRGVEQHVNEIAQDARRKADEVAFTDADAKASALETKILYDPQTGALNQRGKNAFALPEQVGEAWSKGVGEIEQGLSTDQQRAAFRRAMVQRSASVNQTVQRHVAGEMKSYDQDTTKSYVENEYNAAIANAQDPARVQMATDRQAAVLAAYGRRNGMDADQIKTLVSSTLSKTHVGVIDQMLSKEQDIAAQQYFDSHKDAIVGDDSTRVTKALEEGSVRGESQRQADQIVASAKGMPDALDAVRKIADPKIRDATDQRVKQYFTEQKVATEERRQANYQTATNLVEQYRTVDKVPPSLWSTFTVGERGELRNYAEKLVKGEPVQTNWTRYYDLMSLASSDATKQEFLKTNLLADRANLGDAEFKQLTDIQTSLRKDDGKAQQQLGGYQTINEVVERSLKEAGKDPVKAKPGSDDAKNIALFRRSVDVQLQALEQRTGKKATDADAQRIVDNLMVKGTVLGSGGFFGGGKQKAVYERAPGERLVLSAKDIPVLERQRIEQALVANRRPVTDASVLQLYLKKIGTIPTLAPPGGE